jgi:hypothetical protein
MRRSIPKVQFYFCFLVPFGISGNLAILALWESAAWPSGITRCRAIG